MVGRRSYGRTIRVSRRGFTNKFGKWVKKTSYRERDRGKRGRGKPILPKGDHLKKGSMDVVAREMGYPTATAVPEMHIDTYVRKLVKRYGERSTHGKIQYMLNVRKDEHGADKTKFEEMMASLERQYGGGGWTPASR